jgi:hypothetical protein
LKTLLISQISGTISFNDRKDLTLIHLWNKAKRANAIPSEKEIHEPWSLSPVGELGEILKKKLLEIVPLLERHFDKLFVCPDHFRFITSSLKNRRNLSRFVPSILKTQLDSGEVSLSSRSYCNLNDSTGLSSKNTYWLASYLGGLWESKT